MLKKEMTKREIEEFLQNKGDFVQIDYLTRFIQDKGVAIDKRKFALQKLSEIYEKKKMFADAAKLHNNISLISIAYSEKIKNHVKEAELYIKANMFNEVDDAIKKAMNEANSSQREEIYFTIKEFYKKQAEVYEKEMKRGHAVRIYEKLLQMSISDMERLQMKEKLLDLYEKTGKLKEYFKLKNG